MPVCFVPYGIETGKKYLCNLSFDDEDEPQIRMSHISNALRATKDDFAGIIEASQQLIEDDIVM